MTLPQNLTFLQPSPRVCGLFTYPGDPNKSLRISLTCLFCSPSAPHPLATHLFHLKCLPRTLWLLTSSPRLPDPGLLYSSPAFSKPLITVSLFHPFPFQAGGILLNFGAAYSVCLLRPSPAAHGTGQRKPFPWPTGI